MRSSHSVSPLQTQIAGHGSENDGQRFDFLFKHVHHCPHVYNRGLLVHESGFVLKPVQPPPKGTREVAFYQVTYRLAFFLSLRRIVINDCFNKKFLPPKSINSSEDPVDRHFVQLTARFYGTQEVKVRDFFFNS